MPSGGLSATGSSHGKGADLHIVVGDGEPTWQVLGVFMLVALTGLVLRIEAAVRGR